MEFQPRFEGVSASWRYRMGFIEIHSDKMNGSYSTWRETNLGAPQGSVLGSLIFYIFIAGIFYLMNGSNICNFANDTIWYSCDREVKNVITRLELSANHLANSSQKIV